MKKILLVMMLVFSTFMFGNPEFEKSYGESITSTLKFGMTKQEFAKIIQKKALSNSHDEDNYAVYYYANVKDPLGIERQLNSFNFVDGRLVSSVFDSQTTDAKHEQIIKMYIKNQNRLSKEKMTKLEAKGRLLLYNSKKTIEIARMMDHTFITVQTAAPRVLEYKIRSIKQN